MERLTGSRLYTQNIPQEKLLRSISEVPVALSRIPAIAQRRRTTVSEANSWLSLALDTLRSQGESEVVCNDSDVLANLDFKVGSGLSASVFSFNTSTGAWAFKLTTDLAPVPGWVSPSSIEYSEWYRDNLVILQQHYGSHLPLLIPRPQYILALENKGVQRNAIIMPLISEAYHLDDALLHGQLNVQKLIMDITAFAFLSEELIRKYKLVPDLGLHDNIVLQNTSNGELELTLLDNGLIDLKANSPVLNLLNLIVFRYRILKYKRMLRLHSE